MTNFLTRLAWTILLVAMLLSAIYIDLTTKYFIAVPIVIAVASTLCFYEFGLMVHLRGIKIPIFFPMLFLFASCFFYPVELGFLLYLLAGLIVLGFRFNQIVFCMVGFYYCGLLRFAIWASDIDGLRHNIHYYYLFILCVCKINDMFAYVVGKLFGRHKIAPKLSPMKTWEGTIAGLCAGTAAGIAVIKLTPLFNNYSLPFFALISFCLAVTILATVGDAIKSGIKRWAGIKDSGHLFGDMGGVLDVCDSFLISLPFTYLILKLS